MSEHTRGPWEYHTPNKQHLSEVRVSACDGQVSIYSAPKTTETEANARLISAAPEMLQALESLVEWFELDVEPSTKTFERFETARAAIANAKVNRLQ